MISTPSQVLCALVGCAINGASLSEPHTYEENGGFVCLYIYIFTLVQYVYCNLHCVYLSYVIPYISICPTRAVIEHRQYVNCLCCLANAPAKCAKCACAAMDPTAGNSTASSLSDSRCDKEESLRRRRERDRVRRA